MTPSGVGIQIGRRSERLPATTVVALITLALGLVFLIIALVTTPPQAAEALRAYLDAGFVGFTFGNNQLPDLAAIALAGEFIRLVH